MSRRKPLLPEAPPLSPLPPPTRPLPRFWRGAAAALFVLYAVLALGHLSVTPVLKLGEGSFINAPDEPAHLEYVRVLAEENRFPVQGGTTYQWHQPPLYYSVASTLYGAGPKAVRLLGVLLGLGSLGLIFLTVRRVFPDDPVLAVLALGVAALLPMRQAVTASAGNDPLIEFLFCLFLFQLVGAFTNAFTFRRSLQLGATLGAALLAKANGLLLLPLLALALFLLWREGESPRSVLAGAGVMLLAAMMLVTPWLARNYSLYGELTPVRSFMREFEGTAKASDWLGQPRGVDHWSGEITPGAPLTRAGYLGLVGDWSFRTFWAAYTPPRLAAAGVPRFLPPNFYLLYGMVVAAAGAGLTVLHFRRRAEYKGIKQAFIYLWFGTLFLVAASFVGFVWTYFQAQGRYLYPAILPTSALAAMGLRAVFPEQLRDRATLGILALLALLAFAFLLTSVIPTYGG